MTSEAQIEANQLNALKSTGPDDTSGTRFNAVKHGLLSKELSIKREWLNEDPQEYEGLLQRLLDDLKPTSELEFILVERIAVSYWRLRRVLASEHGLMLTYDIRPKVALDFGKENKEKLDKENINIPPFALLDVLGRYETMLERQLYRAVNQLEKMRQQNINFQSIVVEND